MQDPITRAADVEALVDLFDEFQTAPVFNLQMVGMLFGRMGELVVTGKGGPIPTNLPSVLDDLVTALRKPGFLTAQLNQRSLGSLCYGVGAVGHYHSDLVNMLAALCTNVAPAIHNQQVHCVNSLVLCFTWEVTPL